MTTEANDFKQPELYINRELSLLEFNRRVLEQAKDENTPLLERLRFLCISCTNLDEFFEVRVASLKQKVQLGSVQAGADNMTPTEVLKAINYNAQIIVAEQYRVLNDVLIPTLDDKGVYFIRRDEWTPEQKKWLYGFFKEEVLPLLSPLGLDPAHPFPRILNKSLNFIVSLKGKDAFGRNSGMAVVQAPRALSRLIMLPNDITSHRNSFVFLSSVIHAFVDELFPGMKISNCHQFRITRNSDLFVDEEEVDDLLRAVEGELLSRRFGDVVRLEVADTCPDSAIQFLLKQFDLTENDLYQVNGPVNLNRLGVIYDIVDRPELKFPAFTPNLPAKIRSKSNLFEAIAKDDILLHHPFESFVPVVDFVRNAAKDPNVLTIKQTLYRTGVSSAIVDALVNAAKRGIEVTVVIELRARFDEEANITLASRLQEAGVHVVYGVVGYKTHAKLCLVVRREGKRLRHYVHLGTGNYHSRTARIYTDYGLMTCDKSIGEDVHKIFHQLTSLGKVSKLDKLLQSPFSLHNTLLEKIAREIKNAEQDLPAHIIFKVNSLVEKSIIQELYRASNAGVSIDLIIRGICCLRPGLPEASTNIRVRSIIGRFLEHTRIYYFQNNETPEVYGSSADCMDRNFFRRVEIAFPIENKTLRERIRHDLDYYLKDNQQAWILQPDGNYVRLQADEQETTFSAQITLLDELAETS